MKQFRIILRSFAEVKDFVTLAMVQPFQVLVSSSGKHLSGKNFMAMFSLDHSKPLTVSVDCDEDQFARFQQEAARFLFI